MVRLSAVEGERNCKLHLQRFHLQPHRNVREIAASRRRGRRYLACKKKGGELSSMLSVEKAFGVSFRGRQ